MATTAKQDRDFIADLINWRLLEEAIDWIARHMEPGDVFSEDQLAAWAKENGYVDGDE